MGIYLVEVVNHTSFPIVVRNTELKREYHIDANQSKKIHPEKDWMPYKGNGYIYIDATFGDIFQRWCVYDDNWAVYLKKPDGSLIKTADISHNRQEYEIQFSETGPLVIMK
jgi:hypothetical protein